MAQQKTDSMMNIAREWMDIQRNYMMSSMRAMGPTESSGSGFDSIMRKELETTREAVEKTLALEEKALDEFRRGASDIPGLNGMVDIMSEMSRSALQMRGQMWQAWFDQMRSAQERTESAAGE